MHPFDWAALSLFFLVMVVIGFWSFRQVSDSRDFFVAGGNLPWWLSGISHHISGYSGAVFVAYAGLAYTHGFTIYVWWAFGIAIAIFVGAVFIAPRWSRLRSHSNIQSPTEYLKQRYNLPTQQIMAWCGVLLKLFDVAAKWAAIAILLNVFTGASLLTGILLAGIISLIYITVGGLWADVWTDLAQFVVQIVAGFVMFFIVLDILGGFSSIFTMWDQLPEEHSQLFNDPYTAGFALTFLVIFFFSYNGGTWNLATRYISSPSGSDARKAALLSGGLYLVWPLILFFPMWAAPILLPGLEDPTQSYALIAQELLPPGLVGLVLASMFANTMSMTSSDANTISAVITRDILPNFSKKFKNMKQNQSLWLARMSTFIFTGLTIVVAIYADNFGGVLGLIVFWFGALIGPISIPMILGLLPAFRYCGPSAAIISIFGGLTGFVVVNYVIEVTRATEVLTPIAVSFILFAVIGLFSRKQQIDPEVDDLINILKYDKT
ncbi:MAG: Na+:solute symporter [Balneolaceae bacterium]|nr:Na+:solute symporter [Balneolaceae bacterium]